MESKQADLAFLRAIGLFESFSDDDLNRLSQITFVRRYRKHMTIFAEGEPGEAFFFISRGRVKIYKLAADGREHILEVFEAGDAFGLVVVFDHGAYPASAETMEDTVVGLIRVADFDRLMEESPALVRQLLREVSVRLREARARVQDMALRTVHGRLASVLLDLAREKGRPTPRGTLVPIGLTHQELGGLVGASRETITRVLSEFRKHKAIEDDKEGLLIISEEKLRGWS